jgi:hypothetical protein
MRIGDREIAKGLTSSLDELLEAFLFSRFRPFAVSRSFIANGRQSRTA